tara:strand:+ start:22 stop:195 length:174 start_codon:yes stop_codon:yes gene_type:complete
MKKIILNNGAIVTVSLRVANTIRDRIIEGCNDFQCFTDENNDVSIIINLKDVSFLGN